MCGEKKTAPGLLPAPLGWIYIILKLYSDKDYTLIELIVHYTKPSGCCHGPIGVTTTPGPPDEPVTAWPKPGAWLDTPPFCEGWGACPPWLPSGA